MLCYNIGLPIIKTNKVGYLGWKLTSDATYTFFIYEKDRFELETFFEHCKKKKLKNEDVIGKHEHHRETGDCFTGGLRKMSMKVLRGPSKCLGTEDRSISKAICSTFYAILLVLLNVIYMLIV